MLCFRLLAFDNLHLDPHRRRVKDLPLTYGNLVTASLAKSFGRSPMGIENNIKADYPDCKVKRPAIKKAVQKLLDAGTIRNGRSLPAFLCSCPLFPSCVVLRATASSLHFLLLVYVAPHLICTLQVSGGVCLRQRLPHSYLRVHICDSCWSCTFAGAGARH